MDTMVNNRGLYNIYRESIFQDYTTDTRLTIEDYKTRTRGTIIKKELIIHNYITDTA